jgi:hypothetical protein
MKKKKNEKPKEKTFRVTMEMTEDHIRATCDALEAAWRTAMGQTEELINYAAYKTTVDFKLKYALAGLIKAAIYPDLEWNGYYSIGSDKVPPGANMAYEVGRQLAHVKWLYDEPERKASGFEFDHCILNYPAKSVSGLPFPKIEIEEIK